VTDPEEKARKEAEAAASADRLAKLVEALGGKATAEALFGAPVEREGVTVVPVARVRLGAGGGFGRGPRRTKAETVEGEQVGYGQGGGLQASPVGYIELRGGQASFERIDDPVRTLAVVLLIPLVAAVASGIVIAALRAGSCGR